MKYLLAYDGSSNSRRALDFLLKLLKPGVDDAVVVLSVAESIPISDWPSFKGDEVCHELTEKRKTEVERSLEEVKIPLNELNVNYTLLSTVSRDVRAEIIDQIESLQPDMLVLGSRGLGALSGLILGSVSQYCARNSKIPVLVVPPIKAYAETILQ